MKSKKARRPPPKSFLAPKGVKYFFLTRKCPQMVRRTCKCSRYSCGQRCRTFRTSRKEMTIFRPIDARRQVYGLKRPTDDERAAGTAVSSLHADERTSLRADRRTLFIVLSNLLRNWWHTAAHEHNFEPFTAKCEPPLAARAECALRSVARNCSRTVHAHGTSCRSHCSRTVLWPQVVLEDLVSK